MKPVQRFLLLIIICLSFSGMVEAQGVSKDFIDPPHEYSIMPFWFWNDTLKDEEIVRQIADFEAHGVYGFVIHPRIGLPDNIKWLSPEMIHSMNVAIAEASRRKMFVILYDEGMYPSGSSSGQVVARNPEYAARGLAKIDLKPGESLKLPVGKKLINIINRPGGERVAIIEQQSGGNIRGLHYIGEGSGQLKEESPPAGDILNPDAVSSFLELVYDRYSKEFGKYFGTTILGIFTDEPSPLGRSAARGVVAGNLSLLPQIKQILGYDITPFLADLWYNDNAESKKHRIDYNRAVNICLEENYYRRLGSWCKVHGISLMGHPAGSMDIGAERYFQIPGQDLVWRYVEPGPKALEGQHSTMAKCASSAMLHLGLSRNANELYGAYGHNLTYDEMEWLADWCFVRGQNFLIPHAFFYSIRGPRFDERPPDVGPNATWWNKYKEYADACRRLSWLNTDSKQICDLAILSEATFLPDKSARICYQHQRDFNYLELRHLWEDATVDTKGIHIAGMNYDLIVIDSLSDIPQKALPLLKKLARNGRLIINGNSVYSLLFKGAMVYITSDNFIKALDNKTSPDIYLTTPSEDIRYRHVVKGSDNYYIVFNEGPGEVSTKLKLRAKGNRLLLNPVTAEAVNLNEDEVISFKPHELKIIRVNNYFKLPPI
jgi:alpha-L-rhamnosidase